MLSRLELTHKLASKQVFPSSTNKTEHMARVAKDLGCEYSDMLFFDDERRNVRNVSGLGAVSEEVPSGLTVDAFERALARLSGGHRH